MTGTMARPSRPSVRFTALPDADDDEAPKSRKTQPRSSTQPLKNGTRDAGGRSGAAERIMIAAAR